VVGGNGRLFIAFSVALHHIRVRQRRVKRGTLNSSNELLRYTDAGGRVDRWPPPSCIISHCRTYSVSCTPLPAGTELANYDAGKLDLVRSLEQVIVGQPRFTAE